MDFAQFYHNLNDAWALNRVSLDKSEVAYLANKDTFQGRKIGFMTRSYYQREKLIRSSEIYFAYVFQSWSNDVNEKGYSYPTWLLFSPSREVNENPAVFKEIAAKVQSIRSTKPVKKDEKELKKYVEGYLSDISYFPLPESYSCGHFVYLSIVYLPLQRVPSFRLGVNLILANPTASKEVLYLPESYWSEGYRKAYQAGEFVL